MLHQQKKDASICQIHDYNGIKSNHSHIQHNKTHSKKYEECGMKPQWIPKLLHFKTLEWKFLMEETNKPPKQKEPSFLLATSLATIKSNLEHKFHHLCEVKVLQFQQCRIGFFVSFLCSFMHCNNQKQFNEFLCESHQ